MSLLLAWQIPLLISPGSTPMTQVPRVQYEPLVVPVLVADSGLAATARSPEAGVATAQAEQWAVVLASRVGIPEVALAAYGAVELEMRHERPGCHLSWIPLAGIGSMESDHGRFHGATLLPDGRSQPPVIGVALDGRGVAAIADSDGGRLDGDTIHDRAVGPMQFLPTTWRTWSADGDGDGRADPFDLADAALAAGRYLCGAARGDLRQPMPWATAVLSYNHSRTYLAEVTRRANRYAALSLTH